MAVRTIDVRERVMAKNDEIAARVRRRLKAAGVTAFNLVSSPGSGKTLLLEQTLAVLGDDVRMAVITGDVQTQNDADRLARHTDRLVHAVVTGGACHLDARQIEASLEAIDLSETDILFIENVGNLVCPASWDLGEDAKIVIDSSGAEYSSVISLHEGTPDEIPPNPTIAPVPQPHAESAPASRSARFRPTTSQVSPAA